jgi:hypothetical protein
MRRARRGPRLDDGIPAEAQTHLVARQPKASGDRDWSRRTAHKKTVRSNFLPFKAGLLLRFILWELCLRREQNGIGARDASHESTLILTQKELFYQRMVVKMLPQLARPRVVATEMHRAQLQ